MDAVASAEQFQEEAGEDGQQQWETEKPRSGVGAKKETQSSKERCARYDSAWVLHVQKCTTSHLVEREAPQQPTFARVQKPSSKEQVGTAISSLRPEKRLIKFHHIIHLGARRKQ